MPTSDNLNNYYKLEYIQSTGTQYIDTGVKPNKYIGFYIKYYKDSVSANWETIFGCRDNNINRDGSYELQYSTSQTKAATGRLIVYDADLVTINGSSQRMNEASYINNQLIDCLNNEVQIVPNDFMGLYNIHLFCLLFNQDGTETPVIAECSSYKLYRFKLYYGSGLIRDFIPVKHKTTNEVGLFDKVNNMFYSNEGTGTFTAGSIIPDPEYKTILQDNNTRLNTINTTTVPNIQQIADNLPDSSLDIVKYPKLVVVGQSAVYDLGVKYNSNNTEVTVKFSNLSSVFSGGIACVVGTRTENKYTGASTVNNKSFCLTTYNNGNFAYGATDYSLGMDIRNNNNPMQIKLNNTGAYLYDESNDSYTLLVSTSESAFETDENIVLCARRAVVYQDDVYSNTTLSAYCNVTIYFVEIKQNGNTISRLVPATNHGKVGLYDEIQDKFNATIDISSVEGNPIVEE